MVSDSEELESKKKKTTSESLYLVKCFSGITKVINFFDLKPLRSSLTHQFGVICYNATIFIRHFSFPNTMSTLFRRITSIFSRKQKYGISADNVGRAPNSARAPANMYFVFKRYIFLNLWLRDSPYIFTNLWLITALSLFLQESPYRAEKG